MIKKLKVFMFCFSLSLYLNKCFDVYISRTEICAVHAHKHTPSSPKMINKIRKITINLHIHRKNVNRYNGCEHINVVHINALARSQSIRVQCKTCKLPRFYL